VSVIRKNFSGATVGNWKTSLSVSVITDGRIWMVKAHEYEGVLIANDQPVRRLGGLKVNLNPNFMDSALETKEVKE
jgi:hypothetical protein